MLRILASITCALCLFAGSALLADETMSRATMTDSQRLKDCIEKQRTADVAQSKAAMKKFCKDQLKRQNKTGAPLEPPPAAPPPHG